MRKAPQVLQITREQAIKAKQLCLENAESFLQDVVIFIKNEKFDHIFIPLEFALEEIGKAKIITDKLSKTSDRNIITLTKYDGIYNHTKKLSTAVEFLKTHEESLWDRDFTKDKDFETLFGDQFLCALDNYGIDAVSSRAIYCHEMRMSSSFVDFDPKTGDPVLETPYYHYAHSLAVSYLRKTIESLQKDRTD